MAYHAIKGKNPGVVFFAGFKSDMMGSKAIYLQEWAEKNGRSFLRFDYSGHGESEGEFTDGCIGDWAQDTAEIVAALTSGPQVIVGSSMGGWIALLLAKAMPERFHALIGIAAAPDFTEDSMWADFDEGQRATLLRDGQIGLPSEYQDSPYVITRRLIEDGRAHLVLRDPLPLPFPVRLLQGTADASVKRAVPLHLLDHVSCPDIRLTFVKGENHSFSSLACLDIIVNTIEEVSG